MLQVFQDGSKAKLHKSFSSYLQHIQTLKQDLHPIIWVIDAVFFDTNHQYISYHIFRHHPQQIIQRVFWANPLIYV
jgi:hypothetical protein